jgi:hypothetical protein
MKAIQSPNIIPANIHKTRGGICEKNHVLICQIITAIDPKNQRIVFWKKSAPINIENIIQAMIYAILSPLGIKDKKYYRQKTQKNESI